MPDFIVTSEGGRIGEVWWYNSVTMPRLIDADVFGVPLRAVLWGTFGIGRDVTMHFEAVKVDPTPGAA